MLVANQLQLEGIKFHIIWSPRPAKEANKAMAEMISSAKLVSAVAESVKEWRDSDPAQQIDTTVNIVTAENTAFDYRLAGPFRRLVAFVIDFAIRVLIMIVLLILCVIALTVMASISALAGLAEAIYSASGLVGAIILVVWFLQNWFYGALFETFMNGQTPGKWMMGIRVLTVHGTPLNGMQAITRNVLRYADTMPFIAIAAFSQTLGESGGIGPGANAISTAILLMMLFFMGIPTFMVGMVFMAMTRRFQRVGDLICGTMVVSEERSWLMGVARVEDPRTAQLAALLPPKFEVSRSLAQALATYVERRQFFSQARRREIARHLGEPLLRIFGMPADTSHDLLLCALYYRTFIADKSDTDVAPALAAAPYGGQPYGTPPYGMPPNQQGIMFDPPPLPQQTMARPMGSIHIRE